jgi:IMP cyclohydrolase
MNWRQEAESNLANLRANVYPGRGIVTGVGANGTVVQIYWIMGRSENSRNRIFSAQMGRVYTEAADPDKLQDPSLIIYNAMAEKRGRYVVSNGAQTDKVLDVVAHGGTFEYALRHWDPEPDKPNYTPRITAICDIHGSSLVEMSMVRKSRWGDECERFHFAPALGCVGLGYCITTYSGDGNPLPPFVGEPLLMPLDGDTASLAMTYWCVLNEDNRVALVVKTIRPHTGATEVKFFNKYKKVS